MPRPSFSQYDKTFISERKTLSGSSINEAVTFAPYWDQQETSNPPAKIQRVQSQTSQHQRHRQNYGKQLTGDIATFLEDLQDHEIETPRLASLGKGGRNGSGTGNSHANASFSFSTNTDTNSKEIGSSQKTVGEVLRIQEALHETNPGPFAESENVYGPSGENGQAVFDTSYPSIDVEVVDDEVGYNSNVIGQGDKIDGEAGVEKDSLARTWPGSLKPKKKVMKTESPNYSKPQISRWMTTTQFDYGVSATLFAGRQNLVGQDVQGGTSHARNRAHTTKGNTSMSNSNKNNSSSMIHDPKWYDRLTVSSPTSTSTSTSAAAVIQQVSQPRIHPRLANSPYLKKPSTRLITQVPSGSTRKMSNHDNGITHYVGRKVASTFLNLGD